MRKEELPTDKPATEIVGEPKLRGIALNGSEQKDSVDHTEYETARSPDTEVRLDGESDTLFADGIDLEGDFDAVAGTPGSAGTIP